MKGEEFERQLYDLYKREGFDVSLTPRTNDKGVDLLLKKSGRTIAIQAKGYAEGNKVGSSAIQKASGLLARVDIDEVVVATSSSFTTPAREIAKNRGVKLRRFSSTSRQTHKRSGATKSKQRQSNSSTSSPPTYSSRTTEAEEYTCPNCGKSMKRTGWSPYYHHFKNCELPEEKPAPLSEDQWVKVQKRTKQQANEGSANDGTTASRCTREDNSSQDTPSESNNPDVDDNESGAKEYFCPTCGERMKRTGWSPYYHHFKNCELPEEKPAQLSEEQWLKVQENIKQSESDGGGESRSTALRFTSKANSSQDSPSESSNQSTDDDSSAQYSSAYENYRAKEEEDTKPGGFVAWLRSLL
ncbi:restriction endonuclease [Halorussus limi]|uniref:Restriction endonuclease n=1 Tax=Halorussus limi TaxID=2938695 RepID=A0A8U0HQY1_9EURY|nr:restriction endonuclease [Halorussus limi]UPV73153.1 restriction endonuclease [Halorussus limi]